MKKEKQDKKNELGKFCPYYGYNTLATLSKRKKNKQNNTKSHKTSNESKFQKKNIKPNNKSKSTCKSNFKKKTPTCYKCGKVSHYSKDCQLENKINSLEISDKFKILIINLMINKEDDDTTEDSESKEENQILTQEISSEESSQDGLDNKKEGNGICACSYKSINLISKEFKNPLNISIIQKLNNHLLFIDSIYFPF